MSWKIAWNGNLWQRTKKPLFSTLAKRIYRLVIAESTILFEGYLLFAGIFLHLAGRYFDLELAARIGLWLTFPFIATILFVFLLIIPWMWIKHWFSSD